MRHAARRLSYRRLAACPPERREDEQEGAQQRRELSEPQTGDQGPPPAGQVGVQGAWSMLRMETSVCSPQVGVEGALSTQRTER